MDLESDLAFNALGIKLVSIAVDEVTELRGDSTRLKLKTPLVSDPDAIVSDSYSLPLIYGGEPGHIFILVDSTGTVRWFKDYAVPGQNPVMYVEVDELVQELSRYQ